MGNNRPTSLDPRTTTLPPDAESPTMAGLHDPLAETELALGACLVEDGSISPAQLAAAQRYARDHKLDLRQTSHCLLHEFVCELSLDLPLDHCRL